MFFLSYVVLKNVDVNRCSNQHSNVKIKFLIIHQPTYIIVKCKRVTLVGNVRITKKPSVRFWYKNDVSYFLVDSLNLGPW